MMWQTQTTIEYPFALRPASIEEAGLFYSQMDEAEDAVLGTVGHIRMDFGASGKEFYHTWWPHNGDQFNTGEFKDELQKFVDMLRSDGPLTNLASMRNYCYQHGGKITEDGRCFGYIAETEHYRYCLRCTPSPGEYQGYLLTCRYDRGMKTTLTPIVAKLSDMRIVNGDLENMVFEPRKEFIVMQILVLGNIPLLYFLNQEWYDILMHTPMGQIILAVCAAVLFVSTAAVIKLTQPIEYKR